MIYSFSTPRFVLASIQPHVCRGHSKSHRSTTVRHDQLDVIYEHGHAVSYKRLQSHPFVDAVPMAHHMIPIDLTHPHHCELSGDGTTCPTPSKRACDNLDVAHQSKISIDFHGGDKVVVDVFDAVMSHGSRPTGIRQCCIFFLESAKSTC